MTNDDYYEVVPGSKTHKTIMDFMEKRKALFAKRSALIKRFKAGGMLRGDSLVGLIFKNKSDVPAGFRHQTKAGDLRNSYRPDKNTKEGKVLQREFDDVCIPGSFDLTLALDAFPITVGPHGRGGSPVRSFSVSTLDGRMILSVPQSYGEKDGWENRPKDDLLPLKQSEYWKLHEDAEDAKKKAA